MTDFRKIAKLAIRNTARLSEGFKYPEGVNERMHPQLEKELKTQKHSLGKHPIFPESDEVSFEEKILAKRFQEVVNRYKRVFDTTQIDNKEAVQNLMSLVFDSMETEYKHRKELEELAVKMIREEYDMDEDAVEINASLTAEISLEGTHLNPHPVAIDVEFDSHEQIVEANEEVYKRRFINAMIQGAAKKCNQMFHMVEEELTNLDPRLPNKYAKMMAAADYAYFVIPSIETKIEDIGGEAQGSGGIAGGVVKVEFPSKMSPKAIINAQAVSFPVLIHELVKGVMELISANGLPTNKKIGKYVINKADFMSAEPWDMRLGPALWERFTDALPDEGFKLKHHIYAALVALPVREFNQQMKEIMAGTKAGKKILSDLTETVNSEFQAEEFEEAMGGVDEQSGDDETGFDWGDVKDFLR